MTDMKRLGKIEAYWMENHDSILSDSEFDEIIWLTSELRLKEVQSALKIPENLDKVVQNALDWHKSDADQCVVMLANIIVSALARIKELEAEKQEQEDIVLGVGPIRCSNGIIHERFTGCVYCKIKELEAENKTKTLAIGAASEAIHANELSDFQKLIAISCYLNATKELTQEEISKSSLLSPAPQPEVK